MGLDLEFKFNSNVDMLRCSSFSSLSTLSDVNRLFSTKRACSCESIFHHVGFEPSVPTNIKSSLENDLIDETVLDPNAGLSVIIERDDEEAKCSPIQEYPPGSFDEAITTCEFDTTSSSDPSFSNDNSRIDDDGDNIQFEHSPGPPDQNVIELNNNKSEENGVTGDVAPVLRLRERGKSVDRISSSLVADSKVIMKRRPFSTVIVSDTDSTTMMSSMSVMNVNHDGNLVDPAIVTKSNRKSSTSSTDSLIRKKSQSTTAINLFTLKHSSSQDDNRRKLESMQLKAEKQAAAIANKPARRENSFHRFSNLFGRKSGRKEKPKIKSPSTQARPPSTTSLVGSMKYPVQIQHKSKSISGASGGAVVVGRHRDSFFAGDDGDNSVVSPPMPISDSIDGISTGGTGAMFDISYPQTLKTNGHNYRQSDHMVSRSHTHTGVKQKEQMERNKLSSASVREVTMCTDVRSSSRDQTAYGTLVPTPECEKVWSNNLFAVVVPKKTIKTKKLTERMNNFMDLGNTEQSYLQSLIIMTQHYKKLLIELGLEAEMNTDLPHLDDFFDFHSKFFCDLKNAHIDLEHLTVKPYLDILSDKFSIEKSSKIVSMYAEFMFRNDPQIATPLSEKFPQFKVQLEKLESNLALKERKFSMVSLIMNQRPAKYKTMVDNMLKNTPPDHPEYTQVKEVWQLMTGFCSNINRELDAFHVADLKINYINGLDLTNLKHASMDELAERITVDSLNQKKMLAECSANVMMPLKKDVCKVHLLLFEDILLMLEMNEGGYQNHQKRYRVWLRQSPTDKKIKNYGVMSLNHLTIRTVERKTKSLMIIATQPTSALYNLELNSKAEVVKWQELLLNAIGVCQKSRKSKANIDSLDQEECHVFRDIEQNFNELRQMDNVLSEYVGKKIRAYLAMKTAIADLPLEQHPELKNDLVNLLVERFRDLVHPHDMTGNFLSDCVNSTIAALLLSTPPCKIQLPPPPSTKPITDDSTKKPKRAITFHGTSDGVSKPSLGSFDPAESVANQSAGEVELSSTGDGISKVNSTGSLDINLLNTAEWTPLSMQGHCVDLLHKIASLERDNIQLREQMTQVTLENTRMNERLEYYSRYDHSEQLELLRQKEAELMKEREKFRIHKEGEEIGLRHQRIDLDTRETQLTNNESKLLERWQVLNEKETANMLQGYGTLSRGGVGGGSCDTEFTNDDHVFDSTGEDHNLSNVSNDDGPRVKLLERKSNLCYDSTNQSERLLPVMLHHSGSDSDIAGCSAQLQPYDPFHLPSQTLPHGVSNSRTTATQGCPVPTSSPNNNNNNECNTVNNSQPSTSTVNGQSATMQIPNHLAGAVINEERVNSVITTKQILPKTLSHSTSSGSGSNGGSTGSSGGKGLKTSKKKRDSVILKSDLGKSMLPTKLAEKK